MVHIANNESAANDWIGHSFLEVSRTSSSFIEERIREADLDAFIVVDLNVEHREKYKPQLQKTIEELRRSFVFSRSNMAMLGLALHFGWIPAEKESISNFQNGFRRLLSQKVQASGLGFRNQLKQIWGVALGAMSLSSCGDGQAQVADIRKVIEGYRSNRGTPRDLILSSYLLIRLASQSESEKLGDVLLHQLASLEIHEFQDCDAVAVLWALKKNVFLASPTEENLKTINKLYSSLAHRLLNLDTTKFDVVDHSLLASLCSELAEEVVTGSLATANSVQATLRVIDTFQELVKKLRTRRKGKVEFAIEDEYDVQDILYVALKPFIPDLVDEEWTPKDAGGSKRIDLVSNVSKLCIETKYIRDNKHARSVGDELKTDIESYYVHKACNTLIAFIYDPRMLILGTGQLENQLSGRREIRGREFNVIVKVRPG